MKYKIERRDYKIKGTRPRVKLIAETPKEAKMLAELEQGLNSTFGSDYVLKFSGCGPTPPNLEEEEGLFTLEYIVHHF